MGELELDRADLWRLKGEGNANWVFAYTESLPLHLVGKVLRVRKPQACWEPKQAALENEVWGPLLGCIAAGSDNGGAAAAAAAVAREQRYVQQVLAPLLGAQRIPLQQTVTPSTSFLHQLLTANSCLRDSGGGGGGNGGSSGGSLAAGPATLMPDVTLMPGSMPPACTDAATVAAASLTSQQVLCSSSSSGGGIGPVVCIELKPKCGFISSCGTVHPDNRPLKHSRSRYQLHQMLKMAQGSIAACSTYDPCDLFSGEPQRLRRALAALLDHPQNNLLLFRDGQQQLGEQQLGLPPGKPGEPQQQQQPGEQLADGQLQGRVQEQAAEPAEEGELLAALLPLLPPGERRGALVELLAAALEADGVLPRLLQAQQQCQYDIEGVYRLYCRLAGVAPHAEAAEDFSAAAEVASSSGGSSSGGSSSGGVGSRDAGSHAVAVSQLMTLPLEEARAVLRSYVVAATAKDCAIMVTLQRLEDAPLPADGPAAAAAATGGGPGGLTSPPQQQAGLQQRPGRIFVPACGGAWFRYRLHLVDLDLKPLAKVPQHWQLDRRILAAAQRHPPSNHAATAAANDSVMPPS